MSNFHIWGMLNTLKNGQLAKKSSVLKKKKKICAELLNVLWDEGYILGYKTYNLNPNLFEIFLKYNSNLPCITRIKFISKPGKRVYLSSKQLWKIDSSICLILISTSRGVFSIKQCKKLNLGGEPFVLIC